MISSFDLIKQIEEIALEAKNRHEVIDLYDDLGNILDLIKEFKKKEEQRMRNDARCYQRKP